MNPSTVIVFSLIGLIMYIRSNPQSILQNGFLDCFLSFASSTVLTSIILFLAFCGIAIIKIILIIISLF